MAGRRRRNHPMNSGAYAREYCKDDFLDVEEEDTIYDRELERSLEEMRKDEAIRAHEEKLAEEDRILQEQIEREELEWKLKHDLIKAEIDAERKANSERLRAIKREREASDKLYMDELNRQHEQLMKQMESDKVEYDKVKAEMKATRERQDEEERVERLRQAQLDKARLDEMKRDMAPNDRYDATHRYKSPHVFDRNGDCCIC